MTKKLNELSVAEAARALRAREITVSDLFDACRAEALARNDELNAYLEIFDRDEKALADAQSRIDAGDASMLCGIPVSIKDNMLLQGKVSSAGSKILSNFVAPYDSTAVAKLKVAGALFVGRTNMDEFAMGSSTENSAYGPAKNPLDTKRTAGGSSGGAASAQCAHTALISFGSDTGGSIRQPASHTGLVGLKPTYGSVSRHGLIALGSSLDQIGPIAATVADARIAYEVTKGKDEMDSTSREGVCDKTSVKTIGVPWHLLESGVSADVLAHFKEAIVKLEKAGNTIVDISLPSSEYALPAYYVLQPAEASTNLARFDGVRYGVHKEGATLLDDYVQTKTQGFGKETTRRILLGTFVLSSGYIDAYYYKAVATTKALAAEYNDAFGKCDVIAFPTTPNPAFVFGEKSDPLSMYLEDVFTVTANLTGMPALSVPIGTVARGESTLPVGIHFTAPLFGEHLLFEVGAKVTGEDISA